MAVIDPAIATATGGPSWGAAVIGPIVTVPMFEGREPALANRIDQVRTG
jgi:regulator of RNase E activity RraA